MSAKAGKSSDADDKERERRLSSAGSEDSNGDQNNDDDDDEDYSLNHQCESFHANRAATALRSLRASLFWLCDAFTFLPC